MSNFIQGKIWGATRLIFSNDTTEVHRIDIKPGGYCSRHRHKSKSNMFFVELGQLEVLVWRDGKPDTTILHEGEQTTVEAGVTHQFQADRACIAYEIYQVRIDPSDIDRETRGGIHA